MKEIIIKRLGCTLERVLPGCIFKTGKGGIVRWKILKWKKLQR